MSNKRDKMGDGSDLRAIRTAIVALALAVLSAPFVMINNSAGFYLSLLTISLVIYSFVPTMINS